MKKEKALRAVQEYDFQCIEAGLYLDSHPSDKDAMNYFNASREALAGAVENYEKCYGALSYPGNTLPAVGGWGGAPPRGGGRRIKKRKKKKNPKPPEPKTPPAPAVIINDRQTGRAGGGGERRRAPATSALSGTTDRLLIFIGKRR